ncbi:type IV pilus modification protein PilV [Pseudoalteromonas sp. CO325X]|uniref:type IV pilus modification protein PilV n=1 Tax=Pseudoalteromonas sp. CO325X TaxID=1777262 RepID=UPI00102385B8|nr:type IV pilus modification protein PilV [Pseudoalteromonas sp. CO325X]RZF80673.1 type IV pilus modification protein PilV [Pseudoalteromonas sp. CO325X]
MSGRHSRPAHQSGFTLLEALIAFIILTIGLLGTVALQAKAKQASFDSMQRSAALALGGDIMQRIRVNDTQTIAALYAMTFNSADPIQTIDCNNQVCGPAELANYDRNQWLAAIKARDNSGSLDDATVCINTTETDGVVTDRVEVEIIIAWRGRQELNGGDNSVACGNYGNNRRLVRLTSTIHMRA